MESGVSASGFSRPTVLDTFPHESQNRMPARTRTATVATIHFRPTVVDRTDLRERRLEWGRCVAARLGRSGCSGGGSSSIEAATNTFLHRGHATLRPSRSGLGNLNRVSQRVQAMWIIAPIVANLDILPSRADRVEHV
jgi:hypothetical protein